MHWKTKAKIQKIIALLPSNLSYAMYYWMQRKLGGLKKIDPVSDLKGAVETCKLIREQEHIIHDKVFLEIGTGRMITIPIAFWLMGAKKIVTLDLNPYLKLELVKESLDYIFKNKDEIQGIFGSLLLKERFDKLEHFYSNNCKFSITEILDLCCIDYIAPGDAGNSKLLDHSIDYHTSYNVFEHIPKEILADILNEGKRIIKINGLFIHKVDYSDHFAYSDQSISAINFLQYSDEKWKNIAGNRYMYMNRMRHDDFISLYQSASLHIIESRPSTDKCSQDLLKNKSLLLYDTFKLKRADILAIKHAWIVSSSTKT